jgi:hypothetical protein
MPNVHGTRSVQALQPLADLKARWFRPREGRAVLVVLVVLVAWLVIVGCAAALCTIASRGDADETGPANLEEWVRAGARGPRERFGSRT